jgi:hypothetical protein
MEASVDPQPRGPDWMPITPKTGSLFHAETHAYSYMFTSALLKIQAFFALLSTYLLDCLLIDLVAKAQWCASLPPWSP